MAMNLGDRLGHHDVTALLGEGGMGQGWQATDTQPSRDVALEILSFPATPPDRRRFPGGRLSTTTSGSSATS